MKEYNSQYKPKLKLITQNKTLTTKRKVKEVPTIAKYLLLDCSSAEAPNYNCIANKEAELYVYVLRLA